MDAIYSVPIKDKASDKHGVEDTREKEYQFVMVTRDEEATGEEEDDIVVVEKVGIEKDSGNVEKLRRSL